MAERRRGKKKKEQELKDDDDKPTKTEYAIAKYLRDKLPPKKTTLLSHKVEYFIASKAVDCLLDSPWAKSTQGEVVFTNRESVVEYMDRMLAHKLFHRAKKIIVQKDGAKRKKDEEESMNEEEIASTAGKKEKKKKDLKKVAPKAPEKEEEGTKEKESKKEEGSAVEKKKEKKKIKLDMHLEQIFVDGNEPYVWIYDPVPVRAWVIGTLLVIGAVLICLFPLWPKPVRHYVYYLSLAAAGFLVLIIALAILRVVVFVLVWIFSLGKHHLWLLPNLTEDVGFFESFWPLYHYEYKGSKDDSTADTKESTHPSGDEAVPLVASGAEKPGDDSIAEPEPKELAEPTPSASDEGTAPSNSDESDQGSEKNSQGSTGESFEIIGSEENEDAFHKNDTNIAKEEESTPGDDPTPKDT